MAIYKDPIHGRLKLIVKNSGGYDFNYHINKIAEENNLDIKIVQEIMLLLANRETKRKYIQMFKNGYSLEYIRKIENIRKVNSELKLASLLVSIL